MEETDGFGVPTSSQVKKKCLMPKLTKTYPELLHMCTLKLSSNSPMVGADISEQWIENDIARQGILAVRSSTSASFCLFPRPHLNFECQ